VSHIIGKKVFRICSDIKGMCNSGKLEEEDRRKTNLQFFNASSLPFVEGPEV
jgi:hypothetical protein